MKEVFDNYLKNGLSKYDLEYLPTYQYVMLLYNDNIKAYFANVDYTFFIEYPDSNKEYNTPLEVLEEEISINNSSSGIIYENINGVFKSIALIDKKTKNSNKMM